MHDSTECRHGAPRAPAHRARQRLMRSRGLLRPTSPRFSDELPVELALAVKAVARGEMYLSPAIAKYVITNYLQRIRDERRRSGAASLPYEQLTSRQREVLQLIAEGYTTKDIAQRLGISFRTVETHRAQMMERLDIHDVAGLVRDAIHTGLVLPNA